MFEKLFKRADKTPPLPSLTAARERLDVDERLAAARARYEELHGELRRIEHAPPPRAELEARIDGFVSACAAAWLATNGQLMVEGLNSRSNGTRVAFASGTPITFGLLCAVAPDQARVTLASVLARTDYQEGPASAEHQTVMDEIKRELAVLRGEITSLEIEQSEEMSRIYGRRNDRTTVPNRYQADVGPITMPLKPRRNDTSSSLVVATVNGQSYFTSEAPKASR